MEISKSLFLQLREAASATCGNAYLMQDGKILTNSQYKALDTWGKLAVVMFYQYHTSKIVKI